MALSPREVLGVATVTAVSAERRDLTHTQHTYTTHIHNMHTHTLSLILSLSLCVSHCFHDSKAGQRSEVRGQRSLNFSVGACFNVLVPPSGGTPPPSDPRHAPRGAVVLGRVRASLLRQSSLARGVVRDEEEAQPAGSTVSPETHTLQTQPSRTHTHTHCRPRLVTAAVSPSRD